MVTAESVKQKIQDLIAQANEVTGNTDVDLTAAVNSLIAGYGHGEGGGDNVLISILEGGVVDLVLPDGLKNLKTSLSQNGSMKSIVFPDTIETIAAAAFAYIQTLNSPIVFPASLKSIGKNAFNSCYRIPSVTFKGIPENIDSSAFSGAINKGTINCPWSEGEVANAPWGATSATINYNYTEEG